MKRIMENKINYAQLMEIMRALSSTPDIEKRILKRYQIDDLMDLQDNWFDNVMDLIRDIKEYRGIA